MSGWLISIQHRDSFSNSSHAEIWSWWVFALEFCGFRFFEAKKKSQISNLLKFWPGWFLVGDDLDYSRFLNIFHLEFFWIFIELDPKVFDPFARKIFWYDFFFVALIDRSRWDLFKNVFFYTYHNFLIVSETHSKKGQKKGKKIAKNLVFRDFH